MDKLIGNRNAAPSVNGVYGQSGTKYSHYGKRTGLASAMDSQIIERNKKEHQENIGDGNYVFKMFDNEGKNSVDNKPLEFGGRMFFPDSNGLFRVFDKAVLDEQLRLHKEREDYISEVGEYCMVNDEICESVLGKDAMKILRDSGALPSAIINMNSSSSVFAEAMTLFRTTVRNYMPIIQGNNVKNPDNIQ